MKMNLVTKFLLKLFFLTLVLLVSVVLEKYSLLDMQKVKSILSKNINIVNMTKTVNGELNIFDLKEEVINVSLNDSFSTVLGENKYLYKQKNKNIYSTVLGSVVKIYKQANNLYDVVILDENNNLITYSDLMQTNVKIYQIVKVNDIIGVASLNNSTGDDYIYYYLMCIDEN